MGSAAVLLSYAVLLTILPTFDLGKVYGKTPKHHRAGFSKSNSLNISSRSHRFASHPLT